MPGAPPIEALAEFYSVLTGFLSLVRQGIAAGG